LKCIGRRPNPGAVLESEGAGIAREKGNALPPRP
jgi:hypothetical protein